MEAGVSVGTPPTKSTDDDQALTRLQGLRRIQLTLTILRWPTVLIAALFSPLIVAEPSRPAFYVLMAVALVYNALLTLALRFVPLRHTTQIGYLSIILDTFTLSAAIWATGGFYSPFHVAFYSIAINVSIFFRRPEAIVASAVYAASYAVAITAANGPEIWPNIYGEFGLRATFLLLASLFVGQLAEERISLTTINAQLQMEIQQRERIENTLRAMNALAITIQAKLEPAAIYASLSTELRRLGFQVALFRNLPEHATIALDHTSVDPTVIGWMEKMTGNTAVGFELTPRPGGQIERCIRERTAVYFHSVATIVEELLPEGPLNQVVVRGLNMVPIGPVILAPMVVHDEVTGLLAVGAQGLTVADAPAVTAFANQVAIALETAQLVMDLRMSLDELQATQAQLIQSAKMASVGTLAAGVAHEINNPLLAISGRAEQLLTRADQYLKGERALHYVTVIREMADRLSGIVRALLSYSRAGSGEFDTVDVHQAIDETLHLVEHQMAEVQVQIVKDFQAAPGLVDGNKNQLQQVFMNLLINARDAMPGGGRITILTRNVGPDGQQVEVGFTDTGTGMPPEVVARIFDPFFTTKDVGKGTGLGLFVSRGIIERHQGEVDVESTPGGGTTFRIRLPAPVRTPALA